MAVQQNKKSRSRRGMRRAHDALKGPTLSTDPVTGEVHYRHHVTKTGFYRGRNVLNLKQAKTVDLDDDVEDES